MKEEMQGGAGTMARCIGEPISWPRLERHARQPDAAIDAHVVGCNACRACLEAIRGDVVALPALPAITARPPRRARWWMIAAPALAAAAALVLLFVRPRGPEVHDPARITVAGVKGVGDVIVGLQRERAGVVRDDVRTFAPGDRWHVMVTCAASARASIEVEVRDGRAIDRTALPSGSADGRGQAPAVDRPLAPAELACGNDIVVPGAFTLTGTRANDVCVRVHEPTRTEASQACVTISPE